MKRSTLAQRLRCRAHYWRLRYERHRNPDDRGRWNEAEACADIVETLSETWEPPTEDEIKAKFEEDEARKNRRAGRSA